MIIFVFSSFILLYLVSLHLLGQPKNTFQKRIYRLRVPKNGLGMRMPASFMFYVLQASYWVHMVVQAFIVHSGLCPDIITHHMHGYHVNL